MKLSNYNSKDQNKIIKLYEDFDWRKKKRNKKSEFYLSMRDRVRDACVAEMYKILPTIFLHLTFKQEIFLPCDDGVLRPQYIDISTATSTLDVFCHRLSDSLYGRRSLRRGELIEVRGYLEGDPYSRQTGREHLHFHGAVGNLPNGYTGPKRDDLAPVLERKVKEIWTRLDWGNQQLVSEELNPISESGRKSTVNLSRYSLKSFRTDEAERFYVFGNKVHT